MGDRGHLTTLFALSMMFASVCCTGAYGTTVYVNAGAPPGGDGSSWATAHKSLQDGLGAASGHTLILVAEGVYKPDAGAGQTLRDRTEVFHLIDDVEIYGGFPAGGTWADRNPNLYVTVLSGDINTPGDSNDNSYHVVVASGVDNTAVLDGFTITGGNANGSTWYGRGGGMYAYEGYPSVSNCKFILNRAEDGGGVCTYESSTSNSPVSMTLENCIIAGNSAQDNGGGMYIYMSNAVLTGCQFTDNTADSGGGIYGNLSTIGDGCTLTDCTFSENSAVTFGGGIYNYTGGTTTTKCRFLGNRAGDSGGGIYNYISDANIINCTFINNSSDTAAGAVLNLSNTAIISNCLFSCNTSDSIGGLGGSASTSEVTNCTISNNTATWIAGGVGQQDGSINIANSILWGNSDSYGGEGSQIFISSATTEVKYCCIEDINSLAGLGNIDTDPCFMDTGHPDPNLWNLRLKLDSACIDAGDTTAVTGLLDLDANPRIIDAPDIPNTGRSLFDSLHIVDMGAYEFFCAGLYGDINCDGVVDFRDLAILCGNWLARIP